jgi:lysophospholipase L1-like esterase
VKRRVFDLLAAVLCALILGLGIEGYVRFFADDGMQYDLEMWKYARDIKQLSPDPLLGHIHAPNRKATLMGVQFETNSKGLRDREFSYERSSGMLRILMLGDSLTVGWGVPLEETFTKRLERMYAAQGNKAEVINAGVGNYNTIQEVRYFLTEGYKYNPDVVILNFFVNDAEPILPHNNPSVPLRMCYACNFIVGRLDTLMRKFFVKQDWAQYYLALYNDGQVKGWLDARDYILKLADYCKAHGIRLIIASLPELHDVRNYRFQRITDLVHEAANQYKVEFVDVLPYVNDQNSSDLWVTPPDPHPNSIANNLIAHALFEVLQKASIAEKGAEF